MTTNEEGNKMIKEQVLSALSTSHDHVEHLIEASGKLARLDPLLLWKGYSQAELAVGLARLAYEDQRDHRTGSFHSLGGDFQTSEKREKRRGAKYAEEDTSEPERLEEAELRSAKKFLEQSISSAQEGNDQEVIGCARKARDILKILMLSENRRRRK